MFLLLLRLLQFLLLLFIGCFQLLLLELLLLLLLPLFQRLILSSN